jgi:group I intron endonuclease
MKLRELLQEENFCVYKITNLVNGKIYIGKTSDVNKRWKKHIEIAKSQEEKAYQYLHKSINKYGIENFIIEEIENNLTEQESFNREIFWIKTMEAKNSNVGMNLTNGGEGASGLKWSNESRNKISGDNNHNFGKPLKEEVKDKLSVALSGENNPFYGKHHSEKTIKLLQNKEISDEQKKYLSEINSGEKHPHAKFTDQDVIKMRHMFATGEYSQTELAKIFNTKPNVVSQIVNRVRWKHI